MKRLAIFFPQAMPHALFPPFPPCRVHKPKQSNSFHGKYLWTGTWVSELWSLSEKKIGIWFSLNTEANTREIKYTNKREERVGFSWHAFACKFTSSSHSSTWLYNRITRWYYGDKLWWNWLIQFLMCRAQTSCIVWWGKHMELKN